ncbi:MAG: succinate dehydrogenase, cytochrome b556 subunit [Methylophilaceae bacterium]|jgi:succinate dehydrogenase / fumarate reductase, cytochrome b subunit|nr:MAG: succinate dehydrogenase, cytochrome b556 subunit [Methylophilaceae bacterium]
MNNNRPKNLNLLTIRLPINALVSILHRVSGMGLFLLLPLLLLALQGSFASEADYLRVLMAMDFWLVKLVIIGFAWAFFHHFYAGLRHLAQDLHWMHGLHQARYSSRILMGLVVLSVLYFSYLIW